MDLRAFLNNDEGRTISNETIAGLSAVEKAGAIFRSDYAALSDKHAAFQEIIDTLPDETIQSKDYLTELPKVLSLHQLLRAYMEEQKKLAAEFFTDEPDVVYVISLVNPLTEDRFDHDEPFLSWDACAKEAISCLECFEEEGPWRAEIMKYYPQVTTNGFMRRLKAELNEQGELLDISSNMLATIPHYRDLYVDMLHLPYIEALEQESDENEE